MNFFPKIKIIIFNHQFSWHICILYMRAWMSRRRIPLVITYLCQKERERIILDGKFQNISSKHNLSKAIQPTLNLVSETKMRSKHSKRVFSTVALYRCCFHSLIFIDVCVCDNMFWMFALQISSIFTGRKKNRYLKKKRASQTCCMVFCNFDIF